MESKILVVDDQRESLIGLAKILAVDGHDVQTATNGTEGLDLASTFLPDLFLLDVAMPVMDGFEMCRKLKANAILKDIPVLFITAHFDQESIVEGFRLGGVDYISKPFRKEELRMRVATHLQFATRYGAGRMGFDSACDDPNGWQCGQGGKTFGYQSPENTSANGR